MKSFNELIKKSSGKRLLAVFAHPDDESFTSSGLFLVSKKYGIKTRLIVLTKGGRGLNSYKKGNLKDIRGKELKKAVKVLGINDHVVYDYPDAGLRDTKDKWVRKLRGEIRKFDPDFILTFDYSGITGHPDHICSCNEVFKILKSFKKRPLLFWRVPNKIEKDYFINSNEALVYACDASHKMNYGVFELLKKLRAIYAHKSQMQGVKFILRILSLNILSPYEMYYKVDFKKTYKHKFVYFKID